MDKYLIETPHTAQDCQMLVDQDLCHGFSPIILIGDARMEFTPDGRSSKRKTKLRPGWQCLLCYVKKSTRDQAG